MILRAALLLIACLLMLPGCRHSAASMPLPVSPPTKIQQTRAMPNFNHVAVQGRINVVLHTGYSKPQVILKGDPRDLIQVSTRVENYTLIVSLGTGYPRHGVVTVDIRTRYLNTFRFEGAGLVTGTRLNSGLLDLFLANEGRTILGGNINLGMVEIKGNGYTEISGARSQNLHLKMAGKPRVKIMGVEKMNNLNLEGSGALSMYWIKSDILTINASGQAFIQLAGIANRLELCLHDKAQFNGRYLRAKRAFVKTYDHSLAEISTVDRQHTLASDASNIYFFNIPEMKTDFMAYNGSVLDMREWDDPWMKDYDRYNKQLQ